MYFPTSNVVLRFQRMAGEMGKRTTYIYLHRYILYDGKHHRVWISGGVRLLTTCYARHEFLGNDRLLFFSYMGGSREYGIWHGEGRFRRSEEGGGGIRII